MSSTIAARSLQSVSIRPLDGPEDFQRAEQVQVETWDYRDIDVVPAAIFSVARNFGGQALGAMDGDRMVGFALSFGAYEDGHVHLHSHMVAVVPDYQNRGVGRLIKLAQREDALRRGNHQIVWTFDPLQARNAHFNIVRLGGIGVRYMPNLYGKTSSPLHGGMPTDRLLIEWNLDNPMVSGVLNGVPRTRAADAIAVTVPGISRDEPTASRLASQASLREQLMALLSEGYVVTDFERNEQAAIYILEKDRSGLRRTDEN